MKNFMEQYSTKDEPTGKISDGVRHDGVEEMIMRYAIQKGGYWNFRSKTDNGEEIFHAFARELIADGSGEEHFRPTLTIVDSKGMSYTIFRLSLWWYKKF